MRLQDGTEEIIATAREALGLGPSAIVSVLPFTGRGSDRAFYRVRWNGTGSAILIQYNPNRIENIYYADIALFLRGIDVSVPTILFHDAARCILLMEDLGDTDLWSLRESRWETRQGLYKETLRAVQRLHSFPERDLASRRLTLMPGFDLELYQWERDYFRVNFVEALCSLSLDPVLEKTLESELSSLAERLDSGTRSLLHRDLQSQNVMIRNGQPFLIDFQGMRLGNPLYDLGSLLCDPYVNFSSDQREELLSFYYGLTDHVSDWPLFRTHFWEASAQRLMQALGAYGFLGLRKGLVSYLEHVPAGLRNLQEAASNAPSLSALGEVLEMCRTALAERRVSEEGMR